MPESMTDQSKEREEKVVGCPTCIIQIDSNGEVSHEQTCISEQLRTANEQLEERNKELEEEQRAHEQIANILLPLVGTDDGSTVGVARKAASEISELRAKVKEASEIIQWLRDLQNGCPLPKYQKDFERENARADSFLSAQSEGNDKWKPMS